jgi:hypothetical protein
MRFLIRQFRRLRVFCAFVGRVAGDNPDGRTCRISPGTAWELACVYHPSPAAEARNAAMVREAIEWAREIRSRRLADGD